MSKPSMTLNQIHAALKAHLNESPWYIEDHLCSAIDNLTDAISLLENPPEADRMAELTDYNLSNRD